MNKKPGTGPASKSGTSLSIKSTVNKISGSKTGTGFLGSGSTGKPDSNKNSKTKSSFGLGALGSSSSGKSQIFGAGSSKNYPVYSSPKNNKSSAGFGIIWIPGKRNNKKKNIVYTGHNDSYPKGKYERTPTMYHFMSGDSPDSKPANKREEEVDLLMLERSKLPIPAISAAGTIATTSEMPADSTEKPEEKQEFIKRDEIETKEAAAGDTNGKAFKSEQDDDYLDNGKIKNKIEKQDSEKHGDKVDSAFLKLPPHKTTSAPSTVEQDDCGITCLYYTLQCCECVVM